MYARKEALLAGQTCRTGRIEDTQRTAVPSLIFMHMRIRFPETTLRFIGGKALLLMNTIVDPPELVSPSGVPIARVRERAPLRAPVNGTDPSGSVRRGWGRCV